MIAFVSSWHPDPLFLEGKYDNGEDYSPPSLPLSLYRIRGPLDLLEHQEIEDNVANESTRLILTIAQILIEEVSHLTDACTVLNNCIEICLPVFTSVYTFLTVFTCVCLCLPVCASSYMMCLSYSYVIAI